MKDLLLLMKEINSHSMMVLDIYLIMKLNVSSKAHGRQVRKYVESRHFQMVMFLKDHMLILNLVD